MGMWKLELGQATVESVQVNEWYHGVKKGGKELIQSLEDRYLKLGINIHPYPTFLFQENNNIHADMRKD